MATVMKGVIEYTEGFEVELTELHEFMENRIAVMASGDGYQPIRIDLIQLLEWLKENRPELLKNTLCDYETKSDGTWWMFYGTHPVKPLSDKKAASVIWGKKE